MTFQKNAMTLGLCLGLCISMFSQGSPAKRTVKGASPDMSVSDRPVCPAPKGAQHKVIDLCALSRTMSNQPREMEFRELAGTSNWKGVHEDVTLWVGRGDEVIWE